jgi:hypothetical protein
VPAVFPDSTALGGPLDPATGTRQLRRSRPTSRSVLHRIPTLVSMSADRDELRRLVEEIPEEEVPAALADIRLHLRSVSDRPWPPAFFGSVTSKTPDVASRVDEILAEGFGNS